MIHVLNFKDEIIDFISQNDEHIIQANHKRNINDRSETFDFTILSKRTEHLKERNRIIIQDSNKQYREFNIEHISSDIDGYTTVETSASYLQDIATAKPLGPMKLEKMTTMQALKEVLKDTGWEASDETEYGGTRTTSWTSYNTKYEVLLQLCTTYDMMLDFYIELDNNTVKHRYVTLKKRNALFKGKEIVYGKDLTGLKRTVDLSSIKTALLCISPEDDKGQRIVLEVHDDEAQERFGLPKRYIWDVYEPESSDDKMTEDRLRTLGTTELNKRKVEIISYEVSSLDLKDSHPHEVIYLGDKVRVKNRDFSPPLYVEAEVVGEDYNLISKESNYLFGQYKEYREEDLRKAFEKRLNDIRSKLNDSISNVNTIVQETLDTELQYFEKKIIKSNTPPDNAVNDVLWLDTSNPNVPILKRYWNGEWIKSSVDNVEQIGGVTREKALFSELSNTFINLTIQHSKLLNEMYEVINNEYLVDESLKLSLNTNLDKTITTFNNIKTNLDSMTPDTATIGKLVDTQALFLKYREELQALYKVVEQAKISINARFKLLQSQYTDEKFNSAMETVAKTLPNGIWNPDTKTLTSDIPSQAKLDSLVNELKLYVNGQDSALETKIGKSVDAKIVDTKNEFTRQFTEVNTKVDNLEIGGRNLIEKSDIIPMNAALNMSRYNEGVIECSISTLYAGIRINAENLLPNSNYVISYKYKKKSGTLVAFGGHTDPAFSRVNVLKVDNVISTKKHNDTDGVFVADDTNIHTVEYSFTTPETIVSTNCFYIQPNRGSATPETVVVDILEFKLEKGNKATDWSLAPEDIDKSINDVTARVETVEGGLTATNKKFETVYSKTETEQLLNSNLQPIKTDVSNAKSSITQLDKEIKTKVSQTVYTTDQAKVVQRLNSADTERQQLSNQIADRVTLTEYTGGIKDAKDYADSAVDGLEIGSRNLLLNSKVRKDVVGEKPAVYRFIRYTLSKPLEANKNYTLSFKYKTLIGDTLNKLTIRTWNPNYGTWLLDAEQDKLITHNFSVSTSGTKEILIYTGEMGTTGVGQTDIEIYEALLVEGNKSSTWTPAPEDTDQKLTTMKTEILQDGKKISQEVSQQIYNTSSKTLNQTLSRYINDISTGHQFTYDENGNISSFVVGNGGIKINGDKVNITANKEFSAMVNAVANKADETNIVNKINLSREGLDINVNNIGIRGGDSTNYLTIKNQEILSRGIFTRTWGGVTDTPTATVGIKDGYILSRNEKTGFNLYMTEKGLSTMMAGGVGSEQAGALEFHYDLMNDNSRGVRLSSTYGVVFLHSEHSRIYTRSRYTTNIESWESSIYLRPQVNSRTGVNEFSFYVKDNDSAGATDGTILFGEISDEKGLAGSGIRFKKGAIRGQTEPIVYATDNLGNIGTGSFYADNLYGNLKAKTTNQYALVAYDGEFRVTDKNGATGSSINYRAIRVGDINSYGSYANHSGSNVYFGVGTNELRITNNNHYNSGNTTYRPISASDFIKASKAEFKKEITEWNYDALTVLMNELQLYSYKYKNDERGIIHHGAVIGDNYNIPSEFRLGDGINTNEMLSWSLRAIQQLGQKVKELEDKINEQKS
ncbi:phage tail spike protein [Macrococcus armenti]|uniref:phage tail spike protein n=1 Tax=Macrococcus armenti TaxID=2875764 RepID=UPI001CCD6DA3|nr:phage tail spike protein [Macrococcus armenti]UBH07836.1 hypothetical protein LAU41_07320 [Macrococcus armenti]